MNFQSGRNLVTGLIDLPGQSAKFIARIYGFKQDISGNLITVTGRGDGLFGESWLAGATGTLIASGKIRLDGRPAPTSWKGELGTITIQFHDKDTNGADTASTETLSVRVIGQTFKRDEKTGDVWDVGLVCQITDSPTWAGFGDAISAGSETHSDKETYEGLSKQIDPQSLQDGATQRYLVYGIDDTDAAEVTKIGTVIGAVTTPVSGLKLRPAGFARISSSIGVITLQWGRTNTQEDVELPATVTSDDQSNLVDRATICQVTSSSTPPSVPSAPVGKHVMTETVKLHATRWRHTFNYSNNSPKDEIEQGESDKQTDVSALTSQDVQTQVTTSSTPPSDPGTRISGLVLRRRTAKRVTETPEQWRHTWQYGPTTEEEDITFPGTVLDDDASDLGNEKTITTVDDDTPSAPSVPSGYKLVKTRSEQLTDAGKWKYTYFYARRTNQEAVEMDGSNLVDDPSDLADEQEIVLVQSSDVSTATPPSTPSGLSLYDKSSKQIHGASGANKWRNTYVYKRNTRIAQIQYNDSSYLDDVSDIADVQEITLVQSSDATVATPPSTPSGLVLVDKKWKQLTSGLYENTYVYRRSTRQSEIEFGGTRAEYDPLEIYNNETTTVSTVADTLTAAAYADSLMSAAYGDVTVEKYEIQKLNSTKAKATKFSTGLDKLVIASGFNAFRDSVLAVPTNFSLGTDTFGSGSSRVRVGRLSSIVTGGAGGATAGLVMPIRILRTRGRVVLVRRIVTTYANLYSGSTYMQTSLFRQVNAATFCGFPAYTLMYEGPELKYSRAIADGTAHLAEIEYAFQYDSARHFSDQNHTDGWHDCKSGVTLGSTGYFNPATTFISFSPTDFDIVWPTSGDFSVFLA